MELLGSKELTITQDSLKYAGIIASKIKDVKQRKRAYASIVAVDSFSDELARQGFKVNINKNLFKIALINEEFEIADIYCNDWKLDVRVSSDDYVLIPKTHFKYDIAADFYVVIKMDKVLKRALLVGYIHKDDISKTKSVDEYYVVENSALKDYGELIEKMKTVKEKSSTSLSHDSFRESYLAFLDGDIDYVRKKDMIKHLRECEECRADFVEFFDFEAIVSKSKNFPAIFNDQTLDFIGGTAVENPKYEGKEEIIQINEMSVNPQTGQIVSDLFGAAIGAGLASDIPIAAAGALTSAAVSGLSASENNFEDVLDNQETQEEAEDSQDDSKDEQQETIIEFFDGETEDSIAQEEDNVINFDEELTDDFAIGTIVDEELDDNLIIDGVVIEEEIVPENIEINSDNMIDLESDEILDSDLDNIVDENDLVQNIESDDEEDFSFSGLDDDILVDTDSIGDDLSNINEDLDDVGEMNFLEEAGDENEIGVGEDFILDSVDPIDDIIKDVNEGMAVPDIIAPVNDKIEENYKSLEDNTYVEQDDEDDDEIQFINSVSDISATDVSKDEKNEEYSVPVSDNKDLSDEDIQFINSIEDIKLEEKSEPAKKEAFIIESSEETEEDEITFIDDSQQEASVGGDEKQKYQGMFDYSESLVLAENNSKNETIPASYSNVASSSFREAMDISDDDEIETLYSSPASAQSMNIPQMPQSIQNIQENNVDTKRLIVLASVIAGSLLVVSIVGFLMFSNINKNKSEQFNEQVNKVDSLDMGAGDMQTPSASDPGQEYIPPAPTQNPDNLNVTTTTPKDMNKAMTNVFDENASSVTVTKISWEVAKPVAQNPQIARYLQLAGKNIVINLKKNLLNATEFSYNDSAKVFIVLGKDNNIKTLKVVTSSGSEQIDEIVLQSIKETLTYINVPVLADSVQKELGPNAYTYKLVINF